MTTTPIKGVAIPQDIDMLGMINKYSVEAFIKVMNKNKKKAPKKKKPSGSTFRDYRGVDGVVDDANKGKKK